MTVPTWLPQAVFALDLCFGQTSDARQWPAAIGDRDRDHDFVGSRSIIDSDFHAVEVAADEGGIFVAERNVESHAQVRRASLTTE